MPIASPLPPAHSAPLKRVASAIGVFHVHASEDRFDIELPGSIPAFLAHSSHMISSNRQYAIYGKSKPCAGPVNMKCHANIQIRNHPRATPTTVNRQINKIDDPSHPAMRRYFVGQNASAHPRYGLILRPASPIRSPSSRISRRDRDIKGGNRDSPGLIWSIQRDYAIVVVPDDIIPRNCAVFSDHCGARRAAFMDPPE